MLIVREELLSTSSYLYLKLESKKKILFFSIFSKRSLLHMLSWRIFITVLRR